MKRRVMAIMLTFGIIIPATTSANIIGVTTSQWDGGYTKEFWLRQSCDEIKDNSLYVGDYGLYIDNFVAPSTNTQSVHILDAKVITTGKYVLYNNSYHDDAGNGMSILNWNVLVNRNWEVRPGGKVRHMTTAEEINGASFAYSDWRFDKPFTGFDGKVFWVPNYRSDGTHPNTPTKFPSWDTEFRTITLYSTDDKFSTNSDNVAIVECQRNVIRRCGDGILDTSHGEFCDPKDPSHKGWGNGGCNDSCHPVVMPPDCSSDYNGKRVNSITAGDHLCSGGVYTNGSLNYSNSLHRWDWKCNNSTGTVSCWAIKPYCGDGVKDAGEDCDPGSAGTATLSDGRICNSNCKIEDAPTNGTLNTTKVLKSSRYVSYTGEEMEWIITVKAVGGNVKDIVIEDTLPEELSYVSYTKESVPTGITIDSNQPTKTNNGKTITWKPNGTLKENESIVLIVKTKVVKMPDMNGSQNIACAWAPGLDKNCNKPDIPGRLKPDKKIIGSGEITATGDIVEWSLIVTAVGGDVTDIVIEDTLPRVLGYKDYKVLNNGGLSVGAPTRSTITSGGKELETVKWAINGKLEKGKYIEIKLITYAKVMPDRKYNNVLCVRPKDKPDKKDCDPEPIGPSCNSKYHGQTLSSLEKNADLCIGGTVGHFKFNTGDNKWTWTCDNEAGTKSCYAYKETAKKGHIKIDKILQTKEVVDTGDKLDWKIIVTAEGGYVDDVTIRDYLPSILSYDSLVSADLASGVSLNQTKPEKGSDSTGNYVEWKTTGRLNQGNTIVLVIRTKVDKMPQPGKEYRNVACATTGNKADRICDPEPLEGKCDSEYAGKTLTDLTGGNHLCKVGKMTSFTPTATGWTWTCNNYSSKENCSAYKKTGPEPKAGELVIEKVLTGKQTVEKTGQILTWQIKVTASGGVVTGGFRISDVVPRVLEFTGVYKVNYNPAGLTMGERYKGDISELRTWKAETLTGEVWTLNVSGDMQQNQSLILTINTKVKRMPESEKEYRNVACVIKDGDIDCDGDEPDTKGGKLEVEKKIVKPKNKIITKEGESVEWKITVKAVNGDVEMKSIKDTLPNELSYSGYRTLHVPKGITIKKPTIGKNGKDIVWSTTGKLKSGDYISLSLTTIVIAMPNGTIKNVACAVPMTGTEICGEDWTSDLYIEKKVWDKNGWADSTTGNSGDTITYRIIFGNRGNTGAYVSVKDFLPKDIEVKESSLNIRYTDYSTGKGSDNQEPYKGRWEKVENVYINVYSGIYLTPKTEGLMIITGTALHEEDDKHNRTNFACIYDENGNKVACDDAVYNVEEGVLCEKVTLSPESITVKYNEEAKGTTNVTCKTSGGKKGDITIYCGKDDKQGETKKGVDSFSKNCTFEGEGSHDVRCEVDEDIDNSKCKATYTINKGTPPSTPPSNPPSSPQGPDRECVGIDVDYNQKDDQYEVTCHADEPVYFKINGCTNRNKESTERKKSRTFECETIDSSDLECRTNKEDTNSRYKEENKICEYTQDGKINPVQSCFNVNAGNFSIEEGEILPFYWNLERLPNIVGKNKVYVEAFGGNYGNAKNNIKNGGSCSTEGAIAADSMVCTFGIYDGGNYFYGWKKDKNDKVDEPLYKISGPCLSSLTDSELKNGYKLIDKWYDKMVATYCDKDCLSFSLADKGDAPTDERDSDTPYSELLHSSVYYIEKFGKGDKYTVHLGGMGDQDRGMKAAFEGNLEKSYGEYKIVLLDLQYLQCVDNAWQVETGDLSVCQSNFALTNSYTVQKTPSGNLTASTDKLSKYRTMDGKKTFTGFVNNISTTEYNKNANVAKAMDDFIKKYEKLAVKVTGVSKFGGNNVSDLKKVPGKDIYFINGDITVKGGNTIKKPFTLVQTSGKTIIEGNVNHNMMLLTNGDIIFSGDCTSDQKVKGIYYASGSLKRNNNLKKNDDIDNEVWCTNGGLHIQGVLIGNGFDNLMNKSRSNLNMWFKAQESEKKNIVMNGASVLIEYSPSIFTKSTMPPGAEDFTTALSIYRQ